MGSKRYCCASLVATVWACLKAWEEVQSQRDSAEEEWVMGETRDVFQSYGFNHHRLCTGNSAEKGHRSVAMVSCNNLFWEKHSLLLLCADGLLGTRKESSVLEHILGADFASGGSAACVREKGFIYGQ